MALTRRTIETGIRAARSDGKARKLADGRGLLLYVSGAGGTHWRYRCRTAPVAALALALSSSVGAHDPERAMANLASDFTTCSAYLLIISKSIEENSMDSADAFMVQAIAFRGYAIEVSNEAVTDARINVTVKEMLDELGGDLGNVMILFDRHSDLCADISNDIPARLDYWLERED